VRFKIDYPHVRTHEVRLEELNEIRRVEEFFDRLGISPTATTREFCGRAINERRPRKERAQNPTTLDECRKRLGEYIRKAKERGTEIPASAAFTEVK
jgi:hypothetical protein